jgi:hypothetical protein
LGTPLDLQHVASHDGAVSKLLRTLWSRVAGFVDDSLPMPPDQREERDWTPESDDKVSERRRLQIRIRMFEKRGKGGFR